MRRDLLTLGGASIVLAIVAWVLWGNPDNPVSRMHTSHSMTADEGLKLMSERKPLHAK
jgi:hypothetical protein